MVFGFPDYILFSFEKNSFYVLVFCPESLMFSFEDTSLTFFIEGDFAVSELVLAFSGSTKPIPFRYVSTPESSS